MNLQTACKLMLEKKALGIRRKIWIDGVYILLESKRLFNMVEVKEFSFNTNPYIYHLTCEDALADDWDVVL